MESNDVRIFLALARERSVRGAGGVLGVSHSTVTRKIDALERRLGCKLFDRSRDGFSLTAAGERRRQVSRSPPARGRLITRPAASTCQANTSSPVTPALRPSAAARLTSTS